MKKFFPLLAAFLLSISYQITLGQQFESEWSDTISQYAIKQIVSNTQIKSGVNFSYTVIFTFPLGTQDVSIIDNIPPELEVIDVTGLPICGGNQSMPYYQPSIQGSPTQVEYNLSGMNTTCNSMTGSFEITVRFWPGITCDSTEAHNEVGILVNGQYQNTPTLTTMATAINPWVITKNLRIDRIDDASINYHSNSCDYMILENSSAIYEICIHKNDSCVGTIDGQMNMDSIIISDFIGDAQIDSSSLSIPGTNLIGQTVTHNVPVGLNAANPDESYCFEIIVNYPSGSFPVGSQISNSASYSGYICSNLVSAVSDTICTEIVPYSPYGIFRKLNYMTNNVRGCDSYYTIRLDNTNGIVPFDSIVITDSIPDGIIVESIRVNQGAPNSLVSVDIDGANCNQNMVPGFTVDTTQFPLINGSVVDFKVSGLQINEIIYITIHFEIDPTAQLDDTITNCAYLDPLNNVVDSAQNLTSCKWFVVGEPQPKTCINKSICNPQTSYQPNDTIKFRLRVQNKGSAPVAGGNITDLLSSNFEYIGNEVTYKSYEQDPSCSDVNGIPPLASPSDVFFFNDYDTSTTTLFYDLYDIDSNCDIITYPGCDRNYGNIYYYFIEYEVRVKDDAAPGVTPNKFVLDEGDGSVNWSNTVDVLITAHYGMELEKLLRTGSDTLFYSSLDVYPGDTARYLLNLKNTSNVPLSNIKLVDLLGLNSGLNDLTVLNRMQNRGSNFSVDYIGNTSSRINAIPISSPNYLSATGNNICLPDFGISGNCTPSVWVPLNSLHHNFKMEYDTLQLASQKILYEEFDVITPANFSLIDSSNCNDFAAIASTEFMINYQPQMVNLLPVASNTACLTLTDSTCCATTKVWVDSINDCCINLSTKCPVNSVYVDVTNGTIQSTQSNCLTSATGFVGANSFVFPLDSCVITDGSICFDADNSGLPVDIWLNFLFSNGEECIKSIVLDECDYIDCCALAEVFLDTTNNCCIGMTTTCPVDSVNVSVINGTIQSTYSNCLTSATGFIGSSNFNFPLSSCVITDGGICFDADSLNIPIEAYLEFIFTNGQRCTKYIVIDNCKDTSSCCDNLSLTLESDCCARIQVPCNVLEMDVDIEHGILESGTFNGVAIQNVTLGAIGAGNFSLSPNDTTVDLTICTEAIDTNNVIIHYTLYLADGTTCMRSIITNCKDTSSCCDNLSLTLENDCCVKLSTSSSCNVDQIYVEIFRGTLQTGILNNASLNSTFIGQDMFLIDSISNSIDLSLCVSPNDTINASFNFVIYLSDGTTCKKSINTLCNDTTSCCNNVQINWDTNCCMDLLTSCDVVEMDITVGKGEIVSGSYNGTQIPNNILPTTFLSSLSFYNTAANVHLCMNATGNDSIKTHFEIGFSDGTICELDDIHKCDTVTSNINLLNEYYHNYFELINLYPNPSNGTFTVKYAIGDFSDVDLKIVNSLGQEFESLHYSKVTPGIHEFNIKVDNLPTGIYQTVLSSGNRIRTKSIVIK